MLSKICLSSFIVTLALTIPAHAQAQDSPQDYVDAHNAARSNVTDVELEPMTWDDNLTAYAQTYANERSGDCDMVHSNGPYGENLAWCSCELSAADAVQMWVDEKAYYDYNTNSCAQDQMCGHYTQVVWSESVRVGCAKVPCVNGGTFVICNYDPPGNFVGEKPY